MKVEKVKARTQSAEAQERRVNVSEAGTLSVWKGDYCVVGVRVDLDELLEAVTAAKEARDE